MKPTAKIKTLAITSIIFALLVACLTPVMAPVVQDPQVHAAAHHQGPEAQQPDWAQDLGDQFITLAGRLENFPSATLRFQRLSGMLGYAEPPRRAGERWTIVLDPRMSAELAERILWHEMAHCLSPLDDHGAMWGVAYSRVYRAWLAWWEEAGEQGGVGSPEDE